ncbi:hypothetical protein T484DRAFT_1765983 [Baffinella frigidus]|nr:hypothetical protein T484DRAFT_1765983 [Cryptophyta sp. CCMP2293]
MLRKVLILGCSLTLAAGFAPSSVVPGRVSARASAISIAPRVSLRKASGGAPLRMVTDAKPMPVRSKLREEAAFLLPTDGATIAERVAKYVADGELTKADGDAPIAK